MEDLVNRLQKDPPPMPYCYTVLFGKRPLTEKIEGGESIMISSNEENALNFISEYKSLYSTGEPLSVLPLGEFDDIWKMLHLASEDSNHKPPLGLLINFSYASGIYYQYSISQIEEIGKEGLVKGLSKILL